MTDRAAQLREAYVFMKSRLDDGGPPAVLVGWKAEVVDEALRTIALPILEMDEELVNRIAKWLAQRNGWAYPEDLRIAEAEVRELLAALIPEDSE